jgi:hypothetical protein
MGTFKERINLDGFSIENIDLTDIDMYSKWLPKNGVIDINIAEQGLIVTLTAQNLCQEKITQVDRYIGIQESEKNKAWTQAALIDAPIEGHKTVKAKEWYAQADDDYVAICNELALARAAKKWLENKASHFSGWHYAFKTFLKRDYGLEKLGNFQPITYNVGSADDHTPHDNDEDMCGEIDWK